VLWDHVWLPKALCCEDFVEVNGDLNNLASRMGHSNFKMTQGFYRSLKDSAVEEEYKELFEKLDRKKNKE
jgi:hypothetical protein